MRTLILILAVALASLGVGSASVVSHGARGDQPAALTGEVDLSFESDYFKLDNLSN
jgi:hypothetical protein